MNRLMSFALLLFLLPWGQAGAQEPASVTEVEQLRQQVERQERQIRELQLALEHQQQMLESLQQQINPPVAAGNRLSAQPAARETKARQDLSVRAGQTGSTPEPRIENNFGTMRIGGMIHVWYVGGNGGIRDTFRIRRAQLRLNGELMPKVQWRLMADLARLQTLNNSFVTIDGRRVLSDTEINQGTRVLQDAFISLSHFGQMRIDVGQFRVPLGREMQQPGGMLETVERALFTASSLRSGAFGVSRDLGVMISGPLTRYFDYQLGLFNGSGENQSNVDQNDKKTVAARLVVKPPFLQGLELGASGAAGGAPRPDRPRRDRLGGELAWSRDKFKFRAEIMTGKDGDLHRRGWYALTGYHLHPRWEAVVRYDAFDPDIRRESRLADAREQAYLAGLNYLINENWLKLQFNYVRRTWPNGNTPSRNQIYLNLQTWW